MTKTRRKADIRANAHQKIAALRKGAEARAAFLQPSPQTWHDTFLRAIRGGDSIEQAALTSGMTRQGVYYARQNQPDFNTAFRAAYKAGGKARRQSQSHAYQKLAATRIPTTKGIISTQKARDDSVILGKSDFTLRVGPNGPREGYPLRRAAPGGLRSAQ
jgi:hypothetical protein